MAPAAATDLHLVQIPIEWDDASPIRTPPAEKPMELTMTDVRIRDKLCRACRAAAQACAHRHVIGFRASAA